MVSIIMPAYNSGTTISSSIDSVIRQSHGGWELLIYDDASTDDTLSIAREYAGRDQRIKVVPGKDNRGVSFARNTLLKQASGTHVAFLDSDDIWAEEKLERQLSFMDDTGCGLCYSSYGLMDETGGILKKKIRIPREEADYKSLLRNNFIGMLTVVINREATGNIEFSSKRHEDLILWLSLAKGNIVMKGLDEVLAYYRISGKSLSGNKMKAAAWRWNVYYTIEKLGLFKSLFYMTAYIFNSLVKRI